MENIQLENNMSEEILVDDNLKNLKFDKHLKEEANVSKTPDYASLFKKLLIASENEETGPMGNEPVEVSDEGFKLESQVSMMDIHFDKSTGKWNIHSTWDVNDMDPNDFISAEEEAHYKAGEKIIPGVGWKSLIDTLCDEDVTGTWFINITQQDIDEIEQEGESLPESISPTITEANKKPVLDARREELEKLNKFIDKNGLDYLFSHPFEQFEQQFPAMASSLKKYYNGWEGNSRRPIPFADWWKDLDEKYWKGFIFYATSGASGLTANDAYERVNGRYEPNEDGSPDITDINKKDESLKEAAKDKKKWKTISAIFNEHRDEIFSFINTGDEVGAKKLIDDLLHQFEAQTDDEKQKAKAGQAIGAFAKASGNKLFSLLTTYLTAINTTGRHGDEVEGYDRNKNECVVKKHVTKKYSEIEEKLHR